MLRGLVRLCSHRRGQLFLELGFGFGEVAKLLAADGFGAAWLGPAHVGLDVVRRRIVGWLGSRVVRGLILVWPTGRHAAVAANVLLAVFAAAERCGCPSLVVVAEATWDQLGAQVASRLLAAADARHTCTAPCRHQDGQSHYNLYIFAAHAGTPTWTGRLCNHGSHRFSPTDKKLESGIRFGSSLALLLSKWLRQSCDRAMSSRLDALAGL